MDIIVYCFVLLIALCIFLYCARKVNKSVEENKEMAKEGSAMKDLPLVWASVIFLALETVIIGFTKGFYHSAMIDVCTFCLLLPVLAVCSWNDFYVKIIPNSLLIIGVFVRISVFLVEWLLYPDTILYRLLNLLIAAFALLAISMICRLIAPNSIGFGDVKLLTVVGAYLGIMNTWNVMLCTMLILFVACVYLLVMKKADRKSELPFAPFLLIGSVLSCILMGM